MRKCSVCREVKEDSFFCPDGKVCDDCYLAACSEKSKEHSEMVEQSVEKAWEENR